jgi:hypothetical protein
MENTKVLKRVNGQPIQIIDVDGNKLVPIKPICDALGIDVDSQRQKIREDEILSPFAVLSTAKGADGRQCEMLCLPLKFIFGWLFTINPKNVREEARPALIRYKQICYDVLYAYFAEMEAFLEEKSRRVEKCLKENDKARSDFYNYKKIYAEKRANLNNAREWDLPDYRREYTQLKLNFD